MLATHLGFFNTASTRTHVRFQFSTHAAAGGNVAPSSAFEAADLRIYKAADGAAFSATQRSSANGITMTSPFDTLTGFHDVDIDLTDNTDAGFYAAGSTYSVVLAPDETVDSQTITAVVLAYFEIGRPQTDVREIVGDAQSATDLKDFADAGYDPATNKVEGVKLADTLTTYTGNTVQTGDSFARLGAPAGASVSADVAAVKSDTAAILVDTGTTLQAELDGIQADTEDIQAKIGTPAGASVSADIAAVKSDTAAILVDTGTTLDGRIPAALVGGRMDSSVGAMAANTLTATAIASDAITAAKVAADVTTEIQSGLATTAQLDAQTAILRPRKV